MIRETSFVGAGYVIAELASVLLLAALLVTNVGPFAEELLGVSTIAFLLLYMIFLIRDLDDPFGYAARNSVADVSLHPLDHLDEGIERCLAELPGETLLAARAS